MAHINIGTASGSNIGNPSTGDFYVFFDSDNSNLFTIRDSTGNDQIISDPNTVHVFKASDFGTIDSTKLYWCHGSIDMGATSIEVPSGGLFLRGDNLDLTELTSSENTFTMFNSPVGGSGNVFITDISIEASGTGSKVFDLTGDTGNEAIELNKVNFNSCTSVGELDNCRQYLENGTGRFGGTPELTFKGSWNGVTITTSIARGMSNFTSLFKAGASLSFSGRFVTNINCDLPATGALIDFSPSEITNDESLIFDNAFITRSGDIDGSDTTIYPNIDETSVKSKWKNNVGLPNTQKYLRATVITEAQTVIAAASTYYPLLGTWTTSDESHFDMPANGEFRLLSGNGKYQVISHISISGTANDVIDIRVTKSSDNGATWPTVINHLRRQVNSLVGGRDVAFFPINFLADLKKNDRYRFEVENVTAGRNVLMELDSYNIPTEA